MWCYIMLGKFVKVVGATVVPSTPDIYIIDYIRNRQK